MPTNTPRTPRKARTRAAYLNRIGRYKEGEHPVHVYLSGLGSDSARVMGSALDAIADMLSNGRRTAEDLAWHLVRPQHVATLRGRLQELYAPATANRYLTALRAVLKTAWRLELLDRDVMERTLDVPPIRGERATKGRAVDGDELRALFAACREDNNAAAGARDLALLALLYGVGLRRAEVARLELGDYDPDEGSLRVEGKGDKERIVFIPRGTAVAVQRWLERRGSEAGPLIAHVNKSGKVRLRYVSPNLVYRVVQKRLLAAGVEPLTPHDMRRTFISDLLDEGVDLATVSRQVGHSSVQTTARYDRRKDRALRDAAERLDVPVDG